MTKKPIRVLIKELEEVPWGAKSVFIPPKAPNQPKDTDNVQAWLDLGWFIVSASDRTVLLEYALNLLE